MLQDATGFWCSGDFWGLKVSRLGLMLRGGFGISGIGLVGVKGFGASECRVLRF